MVALGEKLRLSKERDDVNGQLMSVKRRIDASKLERKLLKKLIQEQGDSMEDNIKLLEKAGAEDTAQWKQLGAEMAKQAESRAAAGQKVATDQLDKVWERFGVSSDLEAGESRWGFGRPGAAQSEGLSEFRAPNAVVRARIGANMNTARRRVL